MGLICRNRQYKDFHFQLRYNDSQNNWSGKLLELCLFMSTFGNVHFVVTYAADVNSANASLLDCTDHSLAIPLVLYYQDGPIKWFSAALSRPAAININKLDVNKPHALDGLLINSPATCLGGSQRPATISTSIYLRHHEIL